MWYIHTMEYYTAIKKNALESTLMRQMKMQLIIQSEVSQKGKYEIQKDGNDDPICETAKETQR